MLIGLSRILGRSACSDPKATYINIYKYIIYTYNSQVVLSALATEPQHMRSYYESPADCTACDSGSCSSWAPLLRRPTGTTQADGAEARACGTHPAALRRPWRVRLGPRCRRQGRAIAQSTFQDTHGLAHAELVRLRQGATVAQLSSLAFQGLES